MTQGSVSDLNAGSSAGGKEKRQEARSAPEGKLHEEIIAKFVSLLFSTIKQAGTKGVAVAIAIIGAIVYLAINIMHDPSSRGLHIGLDILPAQTEKKDVAPSGATSTSPAHGAADQSVTPPANQPPKAAPLPSLPWPSAQLVGNSGKWELFGDNALLVERPNGRGLFLKPSAIPGAINELPRVNECVEIGKALEMDPRFRSWIEDAPGLADAEIGFWVGSNSAPVGCLRDPERKSWAPRANVDRAVMQQEVNLLLLHRH